LSDYATKLLLSYLSNRKQQIKIGNIVSTWGNIQKDVPQCSILGGPMLFNVFMIYLQVQSEKWGIYQKTFLPTAIAWNFSGFACMQLK
jgi:hypothetical protein